jgi:hypothetical protein
MAITAEIENWLRNQGGYEKHCFISWPHSIDSALTECARRVRDDIEQGLAPSFVRPAVFLDEQMTGGAEWETLICRTLCRSISMVAICAPIYYRPEHGWCGREWAAMEKMSAKRLPGQAFSSIIPLMYKKSDPLPHPVSRIQYIDVSRVILLGRRYYSQPEFRGKIQQMVARIEQIAEEIFRNKTQAESETFPFPTESAFLQYAPPEQPFPLLS